MEKILRPEVRQLKSYIPGKLVSEVQKELGLKEVIKLGSNESSHPPFEEALVAIEKVAKEANRYPDNSCRLLRANLAEFLGVPSENIVVGHGSNELIRIIAQIILRPGDEVIYAKPGFSLYPRVAKLMGAKAVEIPLKGFRSDLSTMLEAVSEKTKLVFICNPHNPTGTIVSKKELNQFMEKLPDYVVVVMDEAYFDFVDSQDYPESINYFRQKKLVVILRTFSKIYGLAGLRVGYGIAPEVIVTAMSKVKEPHNVNSLAQAAALASLGCGKKIKKRKRANTQGKTFLYQELKRLNIDFVPSEANFVLIDVARDSREVFDKLLRKGIIVRTGQIFGTGYKTYLRVTVGTREENEKFVKALESIIAEG